MENPDQIFFATKSQTLKSLVTESTDSDRKFIFS